jgi:hypothetical protein
MAENINIKILIDASESAKTVAETRKALKDLKSAALQVEEGSVAFDQITKASGKLQDKIGDLQATTKFFANDLRNLEGLSSIGEGIAGGFALAQGAAALFGGENKQLEESLLKVQSAMAILQGLQAIGNVLQKESAASLFIQNGIRKSAIFLTSEQAVAEAAEAAAAGTATVAQRALNSAMNANPILALVGLLALAVTALYAFSSSSEKSTKETEKAKKASEDRTKAIEDENKSYSEYIGKQIAGYQTLATQLAESNPKSQERLDLIKKINETYGTTIKNLSDEKTFQDQVSKSIETYIGFLKQKYALQSQQKAIEESFGKQVLLEKELLDLSLKRGIQQDILNSKQLTTYKDIDITLTPEYKQLEQIDKVIKQKENQKIAEQGVVKSAVQNSITLSKTIKESGLKIAGETDKISNKIINTTQKANEKLAELSLAYQNKFLEDARERLKIIEDLQFEIEQLRSDSYSNQFNELKNSFENEREVLDIKYSDDNKALIDALDNKLISEEDFNKKKKLLGNDYNKEDLLIEEKYNLDLGNLLSDNFKNRLNLDIDISKTRFNNRLAELDSLEKLDKERIDATIKNSADKEKAIKDTEFFYLNEKKIATENYYTESSGLLKANFLIENGEIEKNLTKSQNRYSLLSDQADEYKKVVNFNNLELSKATTDEDKKFIQETIDIYNKKVGEVTKSALLEKSISANLKKDKTKLEVDYNKDVIDLTKNTTGALSDEEKQRTANTKAQLDKRKSDWEDFATNVASSVINLLGSAFNSITQARIQGIDRAKQVELSSLQQTQDAYLSSIDTRTNAEKFKADKDAEFAKKKADIEAKYQRQKDEAQYKNEIRQWEYSLAQGAVNLANALLKSAPNPFLLGTTAALGVLELGVITVNKPVKTFGKGGLLDGPSHANGGIATPFGEMEGGEAVINKKSTKQFLPILSAINEAGGGVPLINNSKMAGGAITNVNNNNVDTSNIEAVLDRYFNRPIKTYVVANEVTQQQDRDTKLNNKTSF